ncbi:MAG: tetratricopeptide repeat protein [Prochlorococcus marinus CUG1435]|nr:tetratricopeptide repeat protein [Prochlorococcus marinus CUG1435]
MRESKKNKEEIGSDFEKLSVSSSLGVIKENNSFNSNNLSKPSKQQIIKQAFQFHSKGKILEAAKLYQYFINQGFNDHRVFSNFGIILKDLGKLKEAEALFRKAIEIKPDYAQAYSNMGIILKDLGKLKEAEFSFRKAIEIKPDYAQAYFNLGNIMKDLGKLKEAEFSYCKAIEIKPDYAQAYSNLGNIMKDLGKLKEAEFSYCKAIELKPKFTDAIMNRWLLFFDQGKFDLALKDAESCDTKRSRACTLETLYALGRIDEVYKKIEKTSKLDDTNIRLAAFSSFISEQEKKDTSNNFCRNPLKFLYFSNLKFHHKDYAEFIKKIINELDSIKTIWEPHKKATHGGFQTPVHINLFSNPSKNISILKSIILNELDAYYLKFEKELCSYIQKWPSNRNLKAWHVILKKQGYQEAHIHPAGWLSGVIYLKVVPPLGMNEGAIEFSLNGRNYSNINSPKLIHRPEAGDIVLFPSSLHHRTIPFTSDFDRIVMAFDLLPN